MKLVTLSALAASAVGAALIALPSVGLRTPEGVNVVYVGATLLVFGTVLLSLRIGWSVLFGQVVVPLLVGALAVLLYHWAAPVLAPMRAALAESGELIDLQLQTFTTTTSTIYALLVAFLVFSAMQERNSIETALQEEALHLDSMSEILPHLHDQSGPNAAAEARMHALLIRYADNVLSKRFAHEKHMADNQVIIDGVIDEIYRLRPRDDSDRISLAALVKRVDQLASLRVQRISHMASRPAPLMLVMLIVLSVLVIAPFYLSTGPGALISQALIGSLAFTMAYLFSMLLDMLGHFDGYWAVDRSPFADSRTRIATRLEKLRVWRPVTEERAAS